MLGLGLVVGAALALSSGCGSEEGLRITSIEPKLGTYMGGDTVRIAGTGFADQGVKVYFNQREAPVLSIDGDTLIRVKAPGGKVDEKVDVTVVFANGRSKEIKGAYKYIDPKPLKVDDLTKKDKGGE